MYLYICEYNPLYESLQWKSTINSSDSISKKLYDPKGLWGLILNRALMSPSWMNSWTCLIWCEGRWLNLKMNQRRIPTLTWRSRNKPWIREKILFYRIFLFIALVNIYIKLLTHAVCKRQHAATLLLSSQQGGQDPRRNL